LSPDELVPEFGQVLIGALHGKLPFHSNQLKFMQFFHDVIHAISSLNSQCDFQRKKRGKPFRTLPQLGGRYPVEPAERLAEALRRIVAVPVGQINDLFPSGDGLQPSQIQPPVPDILSYRISGYQLEPSLQV